MCHNIIDILEFWVYPKDLLFTKGPITQSYDRTPFMPTWKKIRSGQDQLQNLEYLWANVRGSPNLLLYNDFSKVSDTLLSHLYHVSTATITNRAPLLPHCHHDEQDYTTLVDRLKRLLHNVAALLLIRVRYLHDHCTIWFDTYINWGVSKSFFSSLKTLKMGRPELIQMAMLQHEQILIEYHVENVFWRRRSRRQERRYWVWQWFTIERRLQYEHYDRLVTELRLE